MFLYFVDMISAIYVKYILLLYIWRLIQHTHMGVLFWLIRPPLRLKLDWKSRIMRSDRRCKLSNRCNKTGAWRRSIRHFLYTPTVLKRGKEVKNTEGMALIAEWSSLSSVFAHRTTFTEDTFEMSQLKRWKQ